ncbi:unannotated protein [freshwater metagenome]|uniref:Unannotated protein n=1 Tax=freshwater metagenome TaxID=449393 RepID=A0A6J7C6K8_9ZZZZ
MLRLLIGVDVEDPVGADVVEAKIPGGGEVAVPWSMQHHGAVRLCDRDRVIAAARIDDDDLVAEIADRREAATKMLCFVLDDDGRSDERPIAGHSVAGIPA